MLSPLVPDEAYYQDWSEHLALGYFDHPPAIAWWIAAGGGHPRLLGWLLAPLAAWFLADAARRLGAKDPWVAPALMIWTPLGLVGGAMATPDIPLVFFWTIVLWAVVSDRAGWVGVAFAACLWSKSTVLVALPGVLWAMPRGRVTAVVIASALYAPHVWWSSQHEWLPWSFQATRTGARWNLFEFIGGQLLLVTPVVLWWIGRAWWAPSDDHQRRLRALSLPIFLAFLAGSLWTRVEGNWACIAWPAAFVLLAVRERPAVSKLAVVLTLAAAVAAPFVATHQTILGGDRGNVEGLEGLPRVAARYQERATVQPSPLYLRGEGHRRSQYDLWPKQPVPACDFVYLAGVKSLAGRCSGRIEEWGRVVACRCPGSTKIGDSPK